MSNVSLNFEKEFYKRWRAIQMNLFFRLIFSFENYFSDENMTSVTLPWKWCQKSEMWEDLIYKNISFESFFLNFVFT